MNSLLNSKTKKHLFSLKFCFDAEMLFYFMDYPVILFSTSAYALKQFRTQNSPQSEPPSDNRYS